MTAEQVMEIIKNMEVEEKWKLLNELYHLHYNKSNQPKVEIEFDD